MVSDKSQPQGLHTVWSHLNDISEMTNGCQGLCVWGGWGMRWSDAGVVINKDDTTNP